ncbi:MAG: glycosyltransferase family 4 protein [Thermodesulfovibrionales bacterium]
MKIGIIAPLWKPVPPDGYGGTELIVSNITEELVRRGHDVTLFASGDSKTDARLVPITEKNLHSLLGGFDWKELSYDILQAERVATMSEEFSIVHNHNGFVPLAFTPFIKTPMITTLHSSLPPEPRILSEAFKDRYFVSISNAQRSLAPYLNYIRTVYHGIKVEDFPFSDKDKGYLLFIGTFSPFKGPDIAIEVAKKSGIPIVLAGERRAEFDEYIKRHIEDREDGEQVIIRGELNFDEKAQLLSGAISLLMPVRWEEAFGLVMVEAMACGTPVIGFRRGSIPEIIEDGKTGFVVENTDEMINSIKKIKNISRAFCRETAENKFSVKRMVDDYERLYEEVKDRTGCASH